MIEEKEMCSEKNDNVSPKSERTITLKKFLPSSSELPEIKKNIKQLAHYINETNDNSDLFWSKMAEDATACIILQHLYEDKVFFDYMFKNDLANYETFKALCKKMYVCDFNKEYENTINSLNTLPDKTLSSVYDKLCDALKKLKVGIDNGTINSKFMSPFYDAEKNKMYSGDIEVHKDLIRKFAHDMNKPKDNLDLFWSKMAEDMTNCIILYHINDERNLTYEMLEKDLSSYDNFKAICKKMYVCDLNKEYEDTINSIKSASDKTLSSIYNTIYEAFKKLTEE